MKVLILAATLFAGALQSDEARELLRLEQELTDALVRLNIATIESLWSDDLVFIGPNGRASTKAERLSGMKASPSAAVVTGATNRDVRVRLYGDTAVVTLLAEWKGWQGDRDYSDRYMTTHLWAKQAGRWRLVSAHVSRMAR